MNIVLKPSGTPRGMSFNAVKVALCEVRGVKELHNLRIWSLTLNRSAIAVHLATGKSDQPFSGSVCVVGRGGGGSLSGNVLHRDVSYQMLVGFPLRHLHKLNYLSSFTFRERFM